MHRVVFVDDGHDAEPEQLAEGVERVRVVVPLAEVLARQKHLGRVAREG